MMKTRTLVVAKYREDVGWLKEVPPEMKVCVYDKSGIKQEFPPEIKVEYIKNVGRDPHTFMYHITRHYHELDDYTCFAQGYPFDHCPKKQFFEKISTVEQHYHELGNVSFTVVGNGSKETGNIPISKVYKEIMGVEKTSFSFHWGMQIILSKELILLRPKSFYENLCTKAELLYQDPFTLPLLERLWRSIWQQLESEL